MRKVRKRLTSSSWSAGVSPALVRESGGTAADQRRVVAGYIPQGSEIDPAPVLETLLRSGWIACLPRAIDRDSPLSFHAIGGPLTADAFGIPASLPEAPVLTPDLLIVPVLAFDRFGGRLGQGAGCYDRTIAALRAVGSVRVVGLAYPQQEVERVPTTEHDERLDGILTDTGFIEVVHP